MKHLKLFQTEAEYTAYKDSEDFILPNVSYVVDSDNVFYTIIPTGTMYTVLLVEQSDISGLSYNMVDLGLSVKWADRNVGANDPEDYGSYFQWGDTVGYKYKGAQQVSAGELATLIQPVLFPDPNADDYVELTADNIGEILLEQGIEGTDLSIMGTGFVKNKLFNWGSYFDTTDGGSTFNKYATDKLTVLEAADDAANVNMGSDYRMPTDAEFTELINGTVPTFIDLQGNEFSKSEAQNGAIAESNLKGVKFTGTNGNSIFIPAAGYCDETMLNLIGYNGDLWSSSLYSSNSMGARYLSFDYYGNLGVNGHIRCYGQSVRGVCN